MASPHESATQTTQASMTNSFISQYPLSIYLSIRECRPLFEKRVGDFRGEREKERGETRSDDAAPTPPLKQSVVPVPCRRRRGGGGKGGGSGRIEEEEPRAGTTSAAASVRRCFKANAFTSMKRAPECALPRAHVSAFRANAAAAHGFGQLLRSTLRHG